MAMSLYRRPEPRLVCELHDAPWLCWATMAGATQKAIESYRNILEYRDMGLSENSVPLNPMVNDHYPY